jgi:hypothetical protein
LNGTSAASVTLFVDVWFVCKLFPYEWNFLLEFPFVTLEIISVWRLWSRWIKIYLFIEMAGMLTASFTLLTFRLRVSLAFRCWRYGFQMLKINQCISTYGAGPSTLIGLRVCLKDGEIILCDIDVSQDTHVQKVDESLQRPVRYVCRLVFGGFALFLFQAS